LITVGFRLPHAAERALPDSDDANEIDYNDAADSNAINLKFESLRGRGSEESPGENDDFRLDE
jgi:hypothetical protein